MYTVLRRLASLLCAHAQSLTLYRYVESLGTYDDRNFTCCNSINMSAGHLLL